jgi:hypothetical protein
VEQVLGLEPGLAPDPAQGSQATEVGTLKVAVLPLKASSIMISML